LVTTLGYNPEEVLRNDQTGPYRIVIFRGMEESYETMHSKIDLEADQDVGSKDTAANDP